MALMAIAIGAVVLRATALIAQSSNREPVLVVRAITRAYDAGRDEALLRDQSQAWQRDPVLGALALATRERLAYRHDDASRWYAQAGATRAHPARPQALLGLAQVRASQGDLRAADSLLRLGTTDARTQFDSTSAVETLLARTGLALRTAGVATARAVLDSARALRTADDTLQSLRTACVALQVDVRAGVRVDDTTWSAVLSQAQAMWPRLYGDCAFVRAQQLSAMGRQAAALALLDTIAPIFVEARTWQSASAIRQWQGDALVNGGNYGRAGRYLREAREFGRRAQSPVNVAWAELGLARIESRLGATVDAEPLMDSALTRFQASNELTGVVLAQRAQAEGAMLKGDFDRADTLLEHVIADASRVAPIIEVGAMVMRAELLRRQSRYEDAATALHVAHETSVRRNQPGILSEILYQRSVLDMERGSYPVAIAGLDSLLSRRIQGPARYEALLRIAEAHARAGAADTALRFFQLARTSLDQWRSGFKDRNTALAALQDRHFDGDRDLGLATIINRLASLGSVDEALAIAEWRHVRAQESQRLQSASLRLDVGGAVVVPATRVDSNALDTQRLPALARTRLRPDEALVVFVTGRGGEPTTAFLLAPGMLRSFALVPADSVAAGINAFSSFLESGLHNDVLAAELSAKLVAPWLDALPEHVKHLTIVPDEALHRLPFGALQTASGEKLSRTLAVTLAPTADDALGTIPRSPRRLDATRPLLIGAPSRMPRDDHGRALAELPGAARELRAVERRLVGAKRLSGRHASLPRVLNAVAEGGPVLHVASHAVASPVSYARTGIALQATSSHDGWWRRDVIAGTALPFDLVVLSACASAEGVSLVGQAIHGMVSAALDAGARGVIATRWDVKDGAMTAFMVRLYDELLIEPRVAVALQRVKASAIAANESPALWSGIDYYGDPTLTITLTRATRSWWSRLAWPFAGSS